MHIRLLAALAVVAPNLLAAQQSTRAVITDPPRDSAHPARFEVLHIPSGGVQLNAIAYVASGAGAHPTVVLFHGLPGNEKDLDLAQAVRRAGWNAIAPNYRGSWGSPGRFRFAGTLEDADAVLAFLRDSANSRRLGVDTSRLVIAGHSMGGWVVAQTAAHDHRLFGAIMISASDVHRITSMPRPALVDWVANRMESLSGVTAEEMADELIGNASKWQYEVATPGLSRTPLLVLTSDDGNGPRAEALVAAVRAAGNSRVTSIHVATDHTWSDKRIALETAVINWLQSLTR